MPAAFALSTAAASGFSSRGARKIASTFCAIRLSTSATCLAEESVASVTTMSQPRLVASSFMLWVSARRQGLLLTICENPTLYLSFLANLGKPLAFPAVVPVLPLVAGVAVGE